MTATADDLQVLTARVRLLEGFVGAATLFDCAQLALQWLGDVLGAAPYVVAWCGEPGESSLTLAAFARVVQLRAREDFIGLAR